MEERQVYISFENTEYRANKTSILQCKAELIQLQKRLTTLRALRSHKKRLLLNLASLVSSAEFLTQKLDDKMPDPSMPKHIKAKLTNKIEKVKKNLVSPKILKEKPILSEEADISNLDKELLELNRRIRELG